MSVIGSVEGCDWGPTLELIKSRLLQCNDKCMEHGTFDDYADTTIGLIGASMKLFDGFMDFVKDQVNRDDNCKFWHDFIFHDCLAYVGLYFAIRGSRCLETAHGQS